MGWDVRNPHCPSSMLKRVSLFNKKENYDYNTIILSLYLSLHHTIRLQLVIHWWWCNQEWYPHLHGWGPLPMWDHIVIQLIPSHSSQHSDLYSLKVGLMILVFVWCQIWGQIITEIVLIFREILIFINFAIIHYQWK